MGTGAFGLFLLAGIVVMVVAIPIRAIWWHRRFGAVSLEHPEMQDARRVTRQALGLWLAGPVTFLIVSLVSRALCAPLTSAMRSGR